MFDLRMKEMDRADLERQLREEAMNMLEAYIYKVKELTWDDDFEEIATDLEQSALRNSVIEKGEWLEENDLKATTDQFKAEKAKLSKLATPIFNRRTEISDRPVAIEDYKKGLKGLSETHAEVLSKRDEIEITEDEVKEFEELIAAEEKWIAEQEAEQNSMPKNKDPILTVKILKEREMSLMKIRRRFDPARRLKPVSTSTATTTATSETSKETEGTKKPGLTPEEIQKLAEQLKAQGVDPEEILKRAKLYEKTASETTDKETKTDEETNPEGAEGDDTNEDDSKVEIGRAHV